jgi:hypothetical protein
LIAFINAAGLASRIYAILTNPKTEMMFFISIAKLATLPVSAQSVKEPGWKI